MPARKKPLTVACERFWRKNNWRAHRVLRSGGLELSQKACLAGLVWEGSGPAITKIRPLPCEWENLEALGRIVNQKLVCNRGSSASAEADPRSKTATAEVATGADANRLPDTRNHDRLEVFDQHRSLLFAIAYRMLGTAADAEDMLQETFIRWQQAPEVEIKSPRAMLVTILSRLSINHLQSARLKREQYFGHWLPEPVVTGPAYDPLMKREVDESIAMAFLLLLERLTPVERAVLVLREVFDYEYSEIASILNHSQASCRQILRRARQHIKEARPRFDASFEKQRELLRRFSDASLGGDVEGLVALLSEDAVFYSDGGGKAPALPKPIYGAQNVARGIVMGVKTLVPKNLVRRFVEINGQPGAVTFLDRIPFSAFTLDVVDGRVARIFVVSNPEKLKRLPPLESLTA
jgi:RNA polymerase sigma-70 factor (ECF subfamily)